MEEQEEQTGKEKKNRYTDQTSIYLEWLEMYILVDIKLVFISFKKTLKNM